MSSLTGYASVFAALFVLGLAGCSAGESTASDDAADTVDPSGTDTLDGKLLVVTPQTPGVLTHATTFRAYTASDQSSSTSVQAGTPAGLRPATNECLVMTEADNGVAYACGIKIESTKTTTYDQIGALTYQGVSPSALEFSEFQFWNMTANFIADAPGAAPTYRAEQFGMSALRYAGTYRASFGPFFDGMDYTVRGGQTTTVDLSSFAQRRSVKILPPASKAFPNAPNCNDNVGIVATRFGLTRSSGITLGAGFIFGEYAPAGQAPGEYTISTGGYAPSFAMSANAGDPPAVVQLARIDVNDVTVRLNDGSSVVRPGTYTIEAVTADGKTVLGQTCASGAPTKTGANVPAGTYRITTTFVTHDVPTDVKTITVH
jgi:hypothetical protein